MKSLLAFSLLVLVLFSCSETKEDTETIQSFEYQGISVDDKIKTALSTEYLASFGMVPSTLDYLKDYYQKRNYQPRWIEGEKLTEEGLALKEVLLDNSVLGLPKHRFDYCTTTNFIQDELCITALTAQIIHDLKNGVINFETKEKNTKGYIPADLFDELVVFESDQDMRQQFMKFGPDDSTYRTIGLGLIALVTNYPIDTTTFEIKSAKYDSTQALLKAGDALVSKGYLKEGVNDSLMITEALLTFQIENGLKPDGIVGKYTSIALNESTYHKVERIVLAMDKLRSQRKYPNKYIQINIPEYKLRLFHSDSVKSEHNIVVGKYKSQTPELESKLKKMVVYPFWNVPYSISSREILPAVKRNLNYLAEHNYKIYKKGEEIDPSTVNWSSIQRNAFPFRVVQQPGYSNALGIIKFYFYNEHNVYFHDTPSKRLFYSDVRAYSHGCMRTQHPVDLAKAILELDRISRKRNSVTPDTLDRLISRAENIQVKLVDPIPIFVDYLTVVKKGNAMVMHLDIYGRDEEYLQILREK